MTSPVSSRSRTSRPVAADIDVFGLTDRGLVRPDNEDHFLIASLHKLLRVERSSIPPDDLSHIVSDSRGYLFLVADGVSAAIEGQRASRRALQAIAEYVAHFMDLYRRVDTEAEKGAGFLAALQQSVLHSHRVLVGEAERQRERGAFATTLTMVAVLWPHAYLVQVGDSRCYRLRDAYLELMTRDQTMAQDLVDSGALSLTDAEQSPLRHVLSSALGGPTARPVTVTTDCRWEDVLLLCTDGLTKHVSDDEIEDELRGLTSAEASCRKLVALALERGGRDNVTVLIGRLKPRS